MTNQIINLDDLADNPTPRVPVCLCLDCSASMSENDGFNGGSRLDELREGIKQFLNAVNDDEIAKYSVDLCVVTFNDSAKCLLSMSGAANLSGNIVGLAASGDTSIGSGVNLALQLLEKRKAQYKKEGIVYHQPWLVVMTDGENNVDDGAFQRAKQQCYRMVSDRKLTIFPVLIGQSVDAHALDGFSPKARALRIGKINFRDFFEWLSMSVASVSSQPIENSDDVRMESWNSLGEN